MNDTWSTWDRLPCANMTCSLIFRAMATPFLGDVQVRTPGYMSRKKTQLMNRFSTTPRNTRIERLAKQIFCCSVKIPCQSLESLESRAQFTPKKVGKQDKCPVLSLGNSSIHTSTNTMPGVGQQLPQLPIEAGEYKNPGGCQVLELDIGKLTSFISYPTGNHIYWSNIL